MGQGWFGGFQYVGDPEFLIFGQPFRQVKISATCRFSKFIQKCSVPSVARACAAEG